MRGFGVFVVLLPFINVQRDSIYYDLNGASPRPAQTCLDEGNWTGSSPLPNFHNFHVYAQTNSTVKHPKKKIKCAYNIWF